MDKIQHVLVSIMLVMIGAAAVLIWCNLTGWMSGYWPIVGGVLLAAVLGLYKEFVIDAYPDIWDLAADAVGIACGVGICLYII